MKGIELSNLIDLLDKVNDVTDEVFKMLNGMSEVLITDEEFVNNDEARVELPRVSQVDKYSTCTEYAVVGINAGIVRAVELDGDDNIAHFNVNDLTSSEAIHILSYFN